MNKFITEIKGFYNSSIHCGATDSLYMGKKLWDVLDNDKLVGIKFCQDKIVINQEAFLRYISSSYKILFNY